jgi:hypothetical protein
MLGAISRKSPDKYVESVGILGDTLGGGSERVAQPRRAVIKGAHHEDPYRDVIDVEFGVL